MAHQRKGKSKSASSPTKAKAEVASAKAAPITPIEDIDQWPQWIKVLILSISVLTFISAAFFTVAGVKYAINANGDKFIDPEDRISLAFAYALFTSTAWFLFMVCMAWLTFYVVSDVFAKSMNVQPVIIPFSIAMKKILPFAMGGMWIGHAVRLGLNLQEIDWTYMRHWAITVLSTSGPALLLYVRVRAKARQVERESKARTAARSRAAAEAAQAAK